MKSIHERWSDCAQAARTSAEDAPPPMPPGFGRRVVRQAFAPRTEDTTQLLMFCARRGLAFASVAALFALAFAWWQLPTTSFASPSVGDEAIEQSLWQP